MKEKQKNHFTIFEYCLGVVFAVINIYVYVGFYSPDDYTLAIGVFPSIVLWVLRISLPLIVCGVYLLYIRLRLKKTDPRAVVVFVAALSFAILIGYQIADTLYQNWFERNRFKFHPYLQLVPQPFQEPVDSSSNIIRIFCLGGSTTELTDSRGKDWESRVEHILNAQYGRSNIKVYNLGREWYTTLHTLINYETNLRPHKPDVILIMQSVNDLLHNADFSVFSHGIFREDYGHFYGPVNRIIHHGSLLDKMNSIISGLWYSTQKEVITTDYFPGIVSYKRNLSTMIELAKHDSTKIILMTEPSLYKTIMTKEEVAVLGMLKVEAINKQKVWSLQTAVNGMKQYNETMKEIAKLNSLHTIDLDSAVPKSLIYFKDDVHYTDSAFSVIAPFIAQELNRLLPMQSAGKQ